MHSAVILLAWLGSDSVEASTHHWDAASALFARAEDFDGTAQERASRFAQAALRYEAAAESREFAGLAWYNAGNAWFHAGEVGRSIACYRQSAMDRPFDALVWDNLAAARALAVDVVVDKRPVWWLRWPTRWLRALIVPATFLFWAMLLGFVRYRSNTWLALAAVSLIAAIALGGLHVRAVVLDGSEGVIVVPEIYGRKGPSFRYQTAFHEPLHDGLEFRVVEERNNWLWIELSDERRCWIPSTQVRRLSNL